MDTNLPQQFLGAYRRGSHEDVTKPIFPTTSELSLRLCCHSSIARPCHSLPDHHFPPRYLDRDRSPSLKDGACAEHCRNPRMFDSTPLPRELPHQPSLLWNRGEHLPHSSPSTGILLQNDNSLPSSQTPSTPHLPLPIEPTCIGTHNPNSE